MTVLDEPRPLTRRARHRSAKSAERTPQEIAQAVAESLHYQQSVGAIPVEWGMSVIADGTAVTVRISGVDPLSTYSLDRRGQHKRRPQYRAALEAANAAIAQNNPGRFGFLPYAQVVEIDGDRLAQTAHAYDFLRHHLPAANPSVQHAMREYRDAVEDVRAALRQRSDR